MKRTFLYLLFIPLTFIVLCSGTCGGTKHEFGCDCENSRTAERFFIVGPIGKEAEFSTYDAEGDNVADASCHAKMELAFRWDDENKARYSTERPPLYYEFKSLFGYFPTNPGMEVKSVSEEGFNFWKIEINEAINKDLHEGSNYGVYMKYDGPVGDDKEMSIFCYVTIEYKYFEERAYDGGCEVDD